MYDVIIIIRVCVHDDDDLMMYDAIIITRAPVQEKTNRSYFCHPEYCQTRSLGGPPLDGVKNRTEGRTTQQTDKEFLGVGRPTYE